MPPSARSLLARMSAKAYEMVVSQLSFACLRYALCGNLAAGRPVKDPPHGKILRNVLNLMLGSRSHEQQVARVEQIPLAVVEEDSATANDKINLILSVRCLLSRVQREGKSYIQRAALEDDNGVLARGARDTCLSLGKVD